MKIVVLLVAILIVSTTVTANSLPISFFGPCQKRCISQFGEIHERITNIDTLLREIEINNTGFSLCRLGCSHPEFSPLNLPEFIYGQIAYQNISTKPLNSDRENFVKKADVLCLDRSKQKKNELVGKVALALEDGVNPLQNVHSIEVIALDLDGDDVNSVVFMDWCYSSECDFSFNALSYTEFRIRVSTFDDDGLLSRPVLSRWYKVDGILILPNNFNKMKLKNVEWKDEKAAARFEFSLATNIYIPMCSFQIEYKNVLSSESKKVGFHLDQTSEILVKNLDFNQNYSISLADDSSESVNVNVPICDNLTDDISMCAPPPVSTLTSHWNTSSTLDSRLIINWNYHSVLDDSADLTNVNSIRTSHFLFSVHPLITSNNEKCERYESIRREVPFSYRKFMFNIPDAKCNYEVEVSVFDTKRRRSESKKIKVTRINEPSFMALLPSNDLQTTIGFIVLLISIVLSFFLIITFCFLKRRNRLQKLSERRKGTVVYAYVDEVTRNVLGVKAPGGRFVPIGDTAREVEEAIANPRPFNIPDGKKRGMFHNAFTNQLQYPMPSESSITPRPYGDIRLENPYDYIMDFHVESELSDDVFEEDICLNTPSIRDSPTFSPMPPIAPFDDFDTLPAYAYRNFRFGKPYETEWNSMCRMNTAVDVLRGHCFAVKYPKDYSDESRQALRNELEILRTLPTHPNCIRFDGVVIGRWDNIPYQITGILLEDCRGGSLRNYINTVGALLRRNGIRTPDNPAAPSVDGSPMSSGYESFISKEGETGKQTPEGLNDVDRVSNAFCRFAQQISGALEYMHRAGILHTRVSPIHVYLCYEYNDPLDETLSNQIVKIGDFGNSSRNPSQVVIESTMPQPPEFIVGKKYESKGDIWQFGVFLVEMSSLGLPYQVRKGIPKSGVTEFDNLPSATLLRDTANKCLKLRRRPTAGQLFSIFMERNS